MMFPTFSGQPADVRPNSRASSALFIDERPAICLALAS